MHEFNLRVLKTIEDILVSMKFAAVILAGMLVLTGCSSTASDQSVIAAPPPDPAPTCSNTEFLDALTMKKINKNPSDFKGTCGFLNIEVVNFLPVDSSLKDRGFPSNCGLGAEYSNGDYPPSRNFDGLFFFTNCADLDEVYEDDVYKVLAIVDGVNTQSNGDRIAQFAVVETRVYETNGSSRLIGK